MSFFITLNAITGVQSISLAQESNENGKKSASTVTDTKKSSDLARKAALAVAKKDWESARDIYKEILHNSPENVPILVNLGTVEFQMKEYADALAHLEKAVRLQPGLAQAWLTIGLAHYERQAWWLSLSALSRAVAEDPADPRAHNYLAATLKGLQWPTAAEASLQRALDLDPEYAEAHFNLALLYLERRPPSPELARRHYLRAVELGSPRDDLMEKQLKEAANEEINIPEAIGPSGSDRRRAGTSPSAATGSGAAPSSSRAQTKE